LIAVALLGTVAAFRQPWRPRLEVLRAGGKGPPTLMLLHGYGSSAAEWLPFTKTIAFPAEGRFLFPQAPEKIGRKDGALDGRAWWDLDLAAHRRREKLGADLTHEDPRGLARAGRLVRRTLDREGNSHEHPFILGGFSQGTMVSCEVAFNSSQPLAALVLLSGTYVESTGWRERMAKRKGLKVFMAHGRRDKVLPFDIAEHLCSDLVAAGLEVTFVPFDGGHEIPAQVVEALGEFLAGVK